MKEVSYRNPFGVEKPFAATMISARMPRVNFVFVLRRRPVHVKEIFFSNKGNKRNDRCIVKIYRKC
jgi:hypothetical protein